MHHNYSDILERIEEPPEWWDQNGTPRWGKFTPELCPNIYSKQVGLFRIACQHCGERFLVEMHGGVFDHRLRHPPKKWHYGDPPRHDCLGGGETMNCEDLEVVEFWTSHVWDEPEWTRREEFEGEIE